MAEHKFQDIWKEQCAAARSVRVGHGILSSLHYRIGENLMTYAETAVTRPEFAREPPRFVGEIRDIFSREEITHDRDHRERMVAIEDPYDEYDGGDFSVTVSNSSPRLAQLQGAIHVDRARDGVDQCKGLLKLDAREVSVGAFDDHYFEVLFATEPGADFDLLAPVKPYPSLSTSCAFGG